MLMSADERPEPVFEVRLQFVLLFLGSLSQQF